MTTRAKRKTSWWVGTLILLGLPVLFVAGLAGYVYLTNARPQKDSLRVRVQPQVVFPWQEAHFLATIAREPEKKVERKKELLDIAFLVDVSGSMTESIPMMADAVREMRRQLSDSRGVDVRFALVRFDTEAEVLVPWTQDQTSLDRGLTQLEAITGSNDPTKLFQRMDELAARSRQDAKRAMVYYTDGVIAVTACPEGLPEFIKGFLNCFGMTYGETAAAAQAFRDRTGIELFCVGLPGVDPHPVMLGITGSSDRIFRPASTADLASKFAALTDVMATTTQVGAQLSQRIDGRQFRTPFEGTSWTRDPSGALRLDIGRVPPKPTTFAHPLVPLRAGLWRVGSEPLRLIYADEKGQVAEVSADARPRILVLTWAVFALPLLPWLLWLLFRSIPERQPVVDVEPPILPIRTPPLPTALPPLPQRTSPAEAVPTLFIGLGGAGLEALHAIRADLEQLHLGTSIDAHRFLALDLDQREPVPSRFASSVAGSIERLVPPREIVQLRDFVPRPGEVPPHLEWFDAGRYEHAAREELNLADGSKGDRTLSRLALFRWLATPERTLVEKLSGEVDAILNAPSENRSVARQIIVVAAAGGGVGGGWFVDVMRLLRRITRARQRESEIIPEIIGVLVSSSDMTGPMAVANRAALTGELESIALTGRFPRRVVMQPGDEILDRTDTESPFDWLMEVGDADVRSAAAQSGALAALLCQKSARRELLIDVGKQLRIPSVVATTGVHILSTLARDQVESDLLLRLLGPDVLLDIQPVRGGYAPRKPDDAVVQQALDAWTAEEPPRTPLRDLLAGGAVPAGDSIVADLRTSIDRRLRLWQPVLAAATLRLLADRLGGASAAARFAKSVADALDQWVRELAAFAGNAADQQRSVSARVEFARTLNRRTYLDSPIDPKTIEDSSRACLERWLGTRDTLSPLRERLFFTVESNGSVLLRSHIANPIVLSSAAEAARELTAIAKALAATVPSLRLSSAIATLDDEERHRLASTLLQSGVRAESVLLAAPPDLDAFRRIIGQPASDGVRRECIADDISSLRRVSVAPPSAREWEVAKPPYVETAERESDRIRARISERYRIRVPALPPELRVAAAHPTRFRSFARMYENGGIVRRTDESGVSRWYAVDRREFLGVEDQCELAEAAANYVYSETTAMPEAAQRSPGDFTALDQGMGRGGDLDDEGLVQAAIRVSQES